MPHLRKIFTACRRPTTASSDEETTVKHRHSKPAALAKKQGQEIKSSTENRTVNNYSGTVNNYSGTVNNNNITVNNYNFTVIHTDTQASNSNAGNDIVTAMKHIYKESVYTHTTENENVESIRQYGLQMAKKKQRGYG